MTITTRSIYEEFEKLIQDVLDAAGYKTVVVRRLQESGTGFYSPDIIAEKDDIQYIIEIKFYRTRKEARRLLRRNIEIFGMTHIQSLIGNPGLRKQKVLLTPFSLEENEKQGVEIWSLEDFLPFVLKNEKPLKSFKQFLKISGFEINELVPNYNQHIAYNSENSEMVTLLNEKSHPESTQYMATEHTGEKIFSELKNIECGKDGWRQFEILGKKALEYLFNDHLSLWLIKKGPRMTCTSSISYAALILYLV